jgi:endoglucanase
MMKFHPFMRPTRRLRPNQTKQRQHFLRDRRRHLRQHKLSQVWGIVLAFVGLLLILRPWNNMAVAEIGPDKRGGIHESALSVASRMMPLRVPLATRQAEIIDSNGKAVLLRGVNWFGIETENHAPHGLWARGYKEMLQQIKTLGYNTIRLPFSVQMLSETSLKGIDYTIDSNRALEGKSPIEVMDEIIQEAGRQGLLILLDSHRLNDQRIPELWYGDGYTEEDWIGSWQQLTERYKNQPNVIGADLKNEPHGSATWGTGDRTTDWRLAAERAGNAILKINPHWLIVVEGVEEGVPGQKAKKHWMGGNLEGVRRAPVRLKVKNQLVYSPHEYGPGVFDHAWFSDPSFPKNLSTIWENSFFYIARQKIAPIFIGEFGGRNVDNKTTEGRWQNTFVDFIKQNNLGFAYWSLNPNSGDTGGILMDDWLAVRKDKQAMLDRLLPVPDPGLMAGSINLPASLTKTPPTPSPRPTPSPTLSASPTPSPLGQPQNLKISLNPQSEWSEGFCLGVQIENPTDQAVSNWQVQFDMPGATVFKSWNGKYEAPDSKRHTITPEDWGKTINPKQTIDLGFCAKKTAKNYRPEGWKVISRR